MKLNVVGIRCNGTSFFIHNRNIINLICPVDGIFCNTQICHAAACDFKLFIYHKGRNHHHQTVYQRHTAIQIKADRSKYDQHAEQIQNYLLDCYIWIHRFFQYHVFTEAFINGIVNLFPFVKIKVEGFYNAHSLNRLQNRFHKHGLCCLSLRHV